MLEFLKKILKLDDNIVFTGALDNKTVDVKHDFNEVVGYSNSNNVIWTEKKRSEWRTFPEMNQYNTGMCGAFSGRKLLGIMAWLKFNTWVDFSDQDIYQRRTNKPNAGMTFDDLFKIMNEGVTLKFFTPEQVMQDSDADNLNIIQAAKDIGKSFGIGKPIDVLPDIETIASIIQTTKKPLIIITYFKPEEWARENVIIKDYKIKIHDLNVCRHFVVVTDYFLWKGEKVLLINDSAWFGGYSQRLLNKDWVDNRIYGCRYAMNFKFADGVGNKPTYTKTTASLQDCLTYDGTFPENIKNRGVYGNITIQAVKDFQKKYNLEITGYLNNQTEAKLSSLFS